MAPKLTKAEVDYTNTGGKDHCAVCKHYSERRCEIVEGSILPWGWCKKFKHNAV
jgi:hypothetical protein